VTGEFEMEDNFKEKLKINLWERLYQRMMQVARIKEILRFIGENQIIRTFFQVLRTGFAVRLELNIQKDIRLIRESLKEYSLYTCIINTMFSFHKIRETLTKKCFLFWWNARLVNNWNKRNYRLYIRTKVCIRWRRRHNLLKISDKVGLTLEYKTFS
jgi:hypothetical protein